MLHTWDASNLTFFIHKILVTGLYAGHHTFASPYHTSPDTFDAKKEWKDACLLVQSYSSSAQ
jgi:hypothetical protein